MEELPNGFLVAFAKISSAQNNEINEQVAVGGINGGINAILKYLELHPGGKGVELAEDLKISQRTLDRLLRQRKDENKIIFKGSRKTGGYYLVDFCNAGVR